MNDLEIAKKYVSKANRAKQAGHEFELSFTSFKNMMKAKKCQYTNLKLTENRSDNQHTRFLDRTIDRIDSTKGYIKGNVITACHGANNFKSIFEDGINPLTPEMAIKICKTMINK